MRSHLIFELLKRAASLLERYLLLWLCISSWLAFQWPGSQADKDLFSRSQPWLPYVIVVTMFAIGWLLPLEEVKQVFRRWPLVLGGTTIQYISMPLLAWPSSPAMRIMVNSSRLLAEIERKRSRSSKGYRWFSASARTRLLKESQDNSRLT